MPVPSLPDEIKDLICDHVLGYSKPDARRTLLALALTSRSFLSCARRALYSNPFHFTPRDVTFPPAIALLEAIEGGLGAFVRHLDDLAEWATNLDTQAIVNEPKRWYELRGQPEGWAWAYAMLKACPKLLSVGLAFNSSSQVSKLSKRLRDLQATLHTLKLGFSLALSQTQLVERRHVLDLLQGVSFPMKSLDVFLRDDDEDWSRWRKGSLAPDAFEYVSITADVPLRALAEKFLPGSSTRLHSLAINMKRDIDPQQIDDLFGQLGGTLTTFRFEDIRAVYEPSAPYSYGQRYTFGHGLSIKALKLLPKINTLAFTSCHSMSLARLETLAEHSPHLQVLDLAGSIWIPDDPSGSTLDAILPDADVTRILKTFSCLHYVHLGFVPLRSGRRLRLLDAAAAAGGWEVRYVTCAPPCWNCGTYHDW